MTDYSKIKVADAFKHIDSQHNLVDDISTGFSSIRYRGKQWILQHGGKFYPFRREDDGTPLSYIDTIFLGISEGTSRIYFGGEWTEDSANAPICTSRKGDVPDPGVPVPQSPTCANCKQSQWTMQPNGRTKPACQEHKKVSILLMPEMTKKMFNGKPLIEPVYLKIPPGSRRSFKAYVDDLKYQNIQYQAVVTRVGFSPDRQFEMSFVLTEALTNAEAKVVLPLMDSPVTKHILGAAPLIRTIEAPKRKDSGLLEAFSGPKVEEHGNPVEAPKKPGRPKIVKTAPAEEPHGNGQTVKPAPVAAPVPEAGGSWDASDDDLDDSVAKLLGDKMGNMLK